MKKNLATYRGRLALGLVAVVLAWSPASEVDIALAAGGAGCDPHYRGEDVCVPVASDVDCAAGKGNGPEYVDGPFDYVGEDIYGLDRDHDGIACEPPPS